MDHFLLTVRWHRAAYAESKPEEAYAENDEGVCKYGHDSEDGGEKQSPVESANPAKGIRVW